MTQDKALFEDLERRGFSLVERWSVTEVLQFIRREMKHSSWPMYLFNFYGMLLVAWGVYFAWQMQDLGGRWFVDLVLPLLLGLFGMVVLIIPHELLHGLGFRIVGARRLRYGANWRMLVFHASAPGYIMSKGAMTLVALLPMIVLNTCLTFSMIFAEEWFWWVFYGALLMHTQGCLGDMAMVNFFVRQPRGSDWITVDSEETTDFFFARRLDEEPIDS